MPRGSKRDPSITRLLYENGLLLDKRSFVGHGTDMVPHLFLKGMDIAHKRGIVWSKSKQRCASCKAGLDDGWEMDHIQGGLVGRCDCLHNLQALCISCHRKKHVQVRTAAAQKAVKEEAEKDFAGLYQEEGRDD